jgi:pimeloyl-ACP methyl ester carboxylesterase
MASVTPEVHHHSVDVSGVSTSFVECGESSHPFVVFLHGWLLAHRAYADATCALAGAGYHVIAPDLPGFGGTQALRSPHLDLEAYGVWLAAFLRRIGVHTPAYVVGHSFGAAVGVHFAALHPKRCAALTLVCPIGGGDWTNQRAMSARPLWEWGLWLPADAMRPDHAVRVVPRVLVDAIPNVLRHPLAMTQTATIARGADVRGHLTQALEAGVGARVVIADNDHVVPRVASDALAAVIGVETTVVGGTHAWPMAEPRRFAEVVDAQLVLLGAVKPVVETPELPQRSERPSRLDA